MRFAPLLLIAACANADAAWETQGLRFQDEGVHKGYATAVNCAGAGITCAVAGGKATLTVPGGGGTGTPGGVSGNIQTNDGAGAFAAYAGTTCAYAVKTLNASGTATCTAAPTIPADISGASYWTSVAESALSNETALGALATGIILNTTTTGIPTIYAGTACSANQYMNALDASGVKTCAQVTTAQLSGTISDAQLANNYSGIGACASGRFASTLNDNAAPTCTQVAYADVSGTPTIPADISGKTYLVQTADATLTGEQAMGALTTGLVKNTTTTGVQSIYAGTSCTNQFNRSLDASGAATCAGVGVADFTANQGTTTQVLHGNAAGQPTWAGVSLTADPTANQGTTTTVLHGNGAGQPTFAAVSLTADVSGILPAANGGTGTSQGNGGCVTLGTANGATVTVGPITWTGTFNELIAEYEITGYGGGTPVGRLLIGAASISTTAATNGTSMSEGIAGTLTNALSIPGAPLAVTLSAIARSGTVHIRGRTGNLKRYEIIGQNGNASVSAASTLFRAAGNFSDLGTNLPIQRAQLTVYDTLATTAASSQTFNSGTTLTMIGCP